MAYFLQFAQGLLLLEHEDSYVVLGIEPRLATNFLSAVLSLQIFLNSFEDYFL